MRLPSVRRTNAILVTLSLLTAAAIYAQTPGFGQWRIAGRDLNNSRSQPSAQSISPANAAQLAVRWTFTTGGDVSATPTVAGNSVYFPDWAGNLFAVRADTGERLWSRTIADYNGRPGSIPA